MSKKWLIPLVGLALTLAVGGVGFALADSGASTPEGTAEQMDEPSGDQPPIRSDEGIDPDECNWVHNITACGDEVDKQGIGACTEGVYDCNDTLVIGPDEEGTIEPDFGEDGPYLAPGHVKCGPDQGVAITSDGDVVSCLDPGDAGQADDGQDIVSPGKPPVVEPAQ